MAHLAIWVEDGPDLERDGVVRWRWVDLARRFEVDFGIKLHERTVGSYLARLGFRRMSVRPEHPKADRQTQAAFKEKPRRSGCGNPVRPGEGKAFGDMVSGRGKGWSTRDADPHPGKTRDTPAHPSRYALQMELYRPAFFAPQKADQNHHRKLGGAKSTKNICRFNRLVEILWPIRYLRTVRPLDSKKLWINSPCVAEQRFPLEGHPVQRNLPGQPKER